MFLFTWLQILSLYVTYLHAVLQEISNFERSDLKQEFTIRLIKNCFLQDDQTVALIGDIPRVIAEKLHKSEIVATTLIGNSRSKAHGVYPEIFRSKSLYSQTFWIKQQRIVKTFVLTAPSRKFLYQALETTRTSIWWNSDAFFIVTSTLESNDCKNAFLYLWTLWRMGILNSIFLCEEDDGKPAVYSYSPYYDGHPVAWRKVEIHSGQEGHPWALVKLEKVQDIDICKMIEFDKVKSLNGHPILLGAIGVPPTLKILEGGKTWFDNYTGEEAMITYTIWKALNGSFRAIIYGGEDPFGITDLNQNYTGLMADISAGKIDLGMNGIYTNVPWRVRPAYPHALSGVHVLTLSKGNMPNWLKFATTYKLPLTMAILATLLIALFCLRYFEHQPWSVAILDVVRVTLSMSISRLPGKRFCRIFWSMVLIMILVTTSGFQGSLVSALTTPSSYRNIDEIEDLLDSGYIIYGYPPFNAFFDDSKLHKQFRQLDKMQRCFDDIDRGLPVACASDYLHLRSVTESTTLYHMSKTSLSPFYTRYYTRPDWPLFNRFDTLVQRLFNSGITMYWRLFYLNGIRRDNWARMRAAVPPKLKVLSLTDLGFVFHILNVGLICSSVAFFVELMRSRK